MSAALAAESINGIQGEGVISTIKHYSLNWNGTNRHWRDAVIDPAAHPEAVLLAFQIAIAAGLGHVPLRPRRWHNSASTEPGAVQMVDTCSVESRLLELRVLHPRWGRRGWLIGWAGRFDPVPSGLLRRRVTTLS